MSRFWKRLMVTGVMALVIVLVGMVLLADEADGCGLCDDAGPRPLVIAHQGGDGERPSNTIAAFEHAVEIGVDMLEMDVHATSDGHLVLMHDETVDRLTDGTGLVKEMTLVEVQALDAAYDWSPNDDGAEFPYRGVGVRVPTLRELFAAFPQMPMNIEIKQAEPSIARALCSEILDAGMEVRVLVASFRQVALDEFRTVCPAVATSLGEDEVRDLYYRYLVYMGASFSPEGVAVQAPIERSGRLILSPRFVETAQGRGMDVHAWTINEEAEMRAMIDLGVDGIITDQPTLLLQLLGRSP